jgi:hypothetical protein
LAEIPSQREGFLFSPVFLSFQGVLPPPFEIRYFKTLEIQRRKKALFCCDGEENY